MISGTFSILVIVVVVFVILSWIVIVPEQQEVIVEMLGKYHKTMRAGVNFKLPIIQTIRNRVSLKEHIHDFPPQSVITKDNVTMKIDTVVYCKVFDSYKNTYMIQNGVDAIEKITATTLRNIVGTMELDELLTARDKINGHLLKEVDEVYGTVDCALEWGRKGGLVTYTFHWFSPIGGRDKSFYAEHTDFDASKAATKGTPEYEAMLRDLDVIADILKKFFGIGTPEKTLEEIGDELHLTRERVRQIKEKAIRKLNTGQRSHILQTYLG